MKKATLAHYHWLNSRLHLNFTSFPLISLFCFWWHFKHIWVDNIKNKQQKASVANRRLLSITTLSLPSPSLTAVYAWAHSICSRSSAPVFDDSPVSKPRTTPLLLATPPLGSPSFLCSFAFLLFIPSSSYFVFFLSLSFLLLSSPPLPSPSSSCEVPFLLLSFKCWLFQVWPVLFIPFALWLRGLIQSFNNK